MATISTDPTREHRGIHYVRLARSTAIAADVGQNCRLAAHTDAAVACELEGILNGNCLTELS
jgi:hypothetical protein